MSPTLRDLAPYLEPIRAYLALDGGDVELLDLSADGKVLYIRLLGSCSRCDLSPTTIQLGILHPLKRYLPSLESVEVVSERPLNRPSDEAN
ncbi:MAG: NifU family protein [Bacteroidia bacterium]|nr:NifU family protein [Bacteroidia bacterium]MDW8088129.1 NifU family protein [Bacteroidia bacterium]